MKASINLKEVFPLFSLIILSILGGGLVVPYDQNDIFKEEIFKLFKELKTRNWKEFREKAFQIREKLFKEKPLKKNSGKKHWWHNFCKKNPEVKEIWKSLDLERVWKKKQKGITQQQSELAEEEKVVSPEIQSSDDFSNPLWDPMSLNLISLDLYPDLNPAIPNQGYFGDDRIQTSPVSITEEYVAEEKFSEFNLDEFGW